jgi:DNA-binding NarL/FixJ family response regulator
VGSNEEGAAAMKTVYIVDDSEAVRERLAALVADVEGVVLAGVSGDPREAVAAIRRLHPDAVILDIRMPGMSGIEVLREIKQDHPSTAVIMLTNYPFAPYRRECTEAGADYFLNKSTEFEKINEILDTVVHKSNN